MADPLTLITVAGATAALAGAAVTAYGTIEGGRRSQEVAERQAALEEAQGRDEFAAAQREAFERRLESKLALSRQQAIAAASGGGAGPDAPTIVKIMESTAQRGAYGAEATTYRGIRLRDALYSSASARRRTGANDFQGSIYSAVGTALGGIGNFGRSIANG